MTQLSPDIALRVCPSLEGHILGHFNPRSLAVKVDQEGCALKAFTVSFRSASTQLFPNLLIHLHFLDRALDMARKGRADPLSGQEGIGTYL